MSTDVKLIPINTGIRGVGDIDLLSDSTILGADVVLWRQAASLTSALSFIGEKPYINNEKLNHCKGQMQRRIEEFETLMHAKKLVVVMASENVIAKSSVNGVLHDLSYNYFLPEGMRFKFEVGRGDAFLAADQSDKFAKILKFLNGIYHEGTVTVANSVKLAHIKDHPTKVLATYSRYKDGHILVIPEVHYEVLDVFFDLLKEFYCVLSKVAEPLVLPPYAKEIIFAEEQKVNNVIDERLGQIAAIQREVEELNQQNQVFQEYKVMLAGTGPALQSVVAKVFKELGFAVDDTDNRKEDLILTYESRRPCAVEVKGKKGTSSSKDRRQLADWVSTYSYKHDVDPKGILVFNGWNELPLHERTEPVFPNEMLGESKRHGYCLISTVDLLSELLAVKSGKKSASAVVEALYQTEGIYSSSGKLEVFLKQ